MPKDSENQVEKPADRLKTRRAEYEQAHQILVNSQLWGDMRREFRLCALKALQRMREQPLHMPIWHRNIRPVWKHEPAGQWVWEPFESDADALQDAVVHFLSKTAVSREAHWQRYVGREAADASWNWAWTWVAARQRQTWLDADIGGELHRVGLMSNGLLCLPPQAWRALRADRELGRDDMDCARFITALRYGPLHGLLHAQFYAETATQWLQTMRSAQYVTRPWEGRFSWRGVLRAWPTEELDWLRDFMAMSERAIIQDVKSGEWSAARSMTNPSGPILARRLRRTSYSSAVRRAGLDMRTKDWLKAASAEGEGALTDALQWAVDIRADLYAAECVSETSGRMLQWAKRKPRTFIPAVPGADRGDWMQAVLQGRSDKDVAPLLALQSKVQLDKDGCAILLRMLGATEESEQPPIGFKAAHRIVRRWRWVPYGTGRLGKQGMTTGDCALADICRDAAELQQAAESDKALRHLVRGSAPGCLELAWVGAAMSKPAAWMMPHRHIRIPVEAPDWAWRTFRPNELCKAALVMDGDGLPPAAAWPKRGDEPGDWRMRFEFLLNAPRSIADLCEILDAMAYGPEAEDAGRRCVQWLNALGCPSPTAGGSWLGLMRSTGAWLAYGTDLLQGVESANLPDGSEKVDWDWPPLPVNKLRPLMRRIDSDITIHELNTRRALMLEGEAMSHCVGSQSMQALRSTDNLRYFSLVSKVDGQRSTLALRESDAGALSVSQHTSHHNAMPDEKLLHAAHELAGRWRPKKPKTEDMEARARSERELRGADNGIEAPRTDAARECVRRWMRTHMPVPAVKLAEAGPRLRT